MACIFITGSTEGLGRAAALALLDDGHEVVLHARNPSRAASLGDLADRAAGVVIGDLANAEETHGVTDQVNAIGRMDAVIHNAGIYIDPRRVATPEGHARTLAVNVLAPYVLTAEIERPARLIYISSGMHRGGDPSLQDMDWISRRWNGVQAYSDSKLFVAGTRMLDLTSVAGRPQQRRRSWMGTDSEWVGRAPLTTSSSDTRRRCGWQRATRRTRWAVVGTGTTGAASHPPRPSPTSGSRMACSTN